MTDSSAAEVREEHIAALRLLLSGKPEAAAQYEIPATDTGYPMVVYSAFALAVRRRFSPTYTKAQVARYVADLRIFLDEDAVQINPRVAENMVRAALGDETLTDRELQGADESAMVAVELSILTDLVHQARLDAAQLEEFLREAEHQAQGWLAAQQAAQVADR